MVERFAALGFLIFSVFAFARECAAIAVLWKAPSVNTDGSIITDGSHQIVYISEDSRNFERTN